MSREAFEREKQKRMRLLAAQIELALIEIIAAKPITDGEMIEAKARILCAADRASIEND